MIFRESAPLSEPFSFAKSAEYPIPPRNVTIIKLVQITLMMNRVMLWPLQEIANPARRSQVAVIKIFSHYREHVEPCSSGRRSAEQRECKSTGEDRIRDDFNRMLIKGCQYLDAGRAVVNLMAYAPENVKIMSRSVPPMKNAKVAATIMVIWIIGFLLFPCIRSLTGLSLGGNSPDRDTPRDTFSNCHIIPLNG
jgi:hypothetical protein